MRSLVLIALLACISGCARIGDDSRYQFGVSADAGATLPGGSGQQVLAWKASQTCPLGTRVLGQETVPTEAGSQIVDQHFQCVPYRPLIDAAGLPWSPAQ